MSDTNDAMQTDLSEGLLPGQTPFLAQDILEEQRQKRRFRICSFVIAWVIAAIFLLSVLCFSYRIIQDPGRYWLPYTPQSQADATNNSSAGDAASTGSNPMNQMLVLLSLLSAVGTTLAVSVMRFSFSKEYKPQDEDSPTPVSPVATSLSEVLKATADMLKKDK